GGGGGAWGGAAPRPDPGRVSRCPQRRCTTWSSPQIDLVPLVFFPLKPNAGPQPRPEAGAKRRLEGVGCRRWFGGGRPVGYGEGLPSPSAPLLFLLITPPCHLPAPILLPTLTPRPPRTAPSTGTCARGPSAS